MGMQRERGKEKEKEYYLGNILSSVVHEASSKLLHAVKSSKKMANGVKRESIVAYFIRLVVRMKTFLEEKANIKTLLGLNTRLREGNVQMKADCPVHLGALMLGIFCPDIYNTGENCFRIVTGQKNLREIRRKTKKTYKGGKSHRVESRIGKKRGGGEEEVKKGNIR